MDCHDEPKFSYSKILVLKDYKILHVFEMVHILGPATLRATQPNIFFLIFSPVLLLLLLFFVIFFPIQGAVRIKSKQIESACPISI